MEEITLADTNSNQIPAEAPVGIERQIGSVLPHQIVERMMDGRFRLRPEIVDCINQGEITLAMIRPGVEEISAYQGVECLECPDRKIDPMMIIDEIERRGLSILAAFDVQFDKAFIDRFYAGKPKELQLMQPPLKDVSSANRWEEFVRYMTASKTTVLLLGVTKPEGFQGFRHDHSVRYNTVDKWREAQGHWDVQTRRDPTTIRGTLAPDNYNNLIHGSDSPQRVIEEMGMIMAHILEADVILPANEDGVEALTSILRHKGAIDGETKILDIKRGEIYFSGETVSRSVDIITSDGRTIGLYEKSAITFTPVETVEGWIRRRKVFESWGGSAPVLYSANKGSILEERIPLSLRQAFEQANSAQRMQLMDSLAKVGAALERAGFNMLIIVGDMMSRGDNAVVVDYGFDMGEPSRPISYSQRTLIQIIGELSNRRSQINLRDGEIDVLTRAYENISDCQPKWPVVLRKINDRLTIYQNNYSQILSW